MGPKSQKQSVAIPKVSCSLPPLGVQVARCRRRTHFDKMTFDPDYGDGMLYVRFMHNSLADPPPVCDNLCFSFILPEKNEDKETSAQDDRKKASKRRRSTDKGEDSSTSDIAMI